jgi:uncharacterized membrane-anchored protein YhcB (DUF1043 family)
MIALTIGIIIGYLWAAEDKRYLNRQQALEKAKVILYRELYIAINELSAGRILNYYFL